VPYLYISTGTGPYNAWIDPITINEWQEMALHEVQTLTGKGVPGVWHHGFYDGWSAGYGFYVANGHNGIGRFYETFSGGGADTGIRSAGNTGREWYRPNPPFPRVRWSIRNNVNLSQSGLLLGMHKVASEKDKFLRNYYLKSKRSIDKARAEGPAAWILPADEAKGYEQNRLLKVMEAQGVEVHQTTAQTETEQGTFPAGSYVIRMDQPYSRMADMLLDTQYYKPTDPRSYDDTGWTLGSLFNVKTTRVRDMKVLDAPMKPAILGMTGMGGSGNWHTAQKFVLDTAGSAAAAEVLAAFPNHRFELLQQPYDSGRQTFPAGSLVVVRGGQSEIGLQVHEQAVRLRIPFSSLPEDAKTQALTLPRVALVHTWTSTQDEGWARMALDQLKFPYKYVSVHELRDTHNLRAKYDVILMPQTRGTAQSLLNGHPKTGEPRPWKASAEYPNLGGPDSSDDIRGGIELEGIMNLKRFLDEGGLFIAIGNSVRVPVELGIVSGVTIVQPDQLNAPGGVYRLLRDDKETPVLFGYQEELAGYFNMNSLPILSTGSGGRRPTPSAAAGRSSGRGSATDPDVIQGRGAYTPKQLPGDVPEGGTFRAPTDPLRPRVLLKFAEADKLLISGMAVAPEELDGRAAVIHAPVGKGDVLLFSINPFWRGQTVGSYGMFFNAILNRENLRR
jgi:hypothetical protein